MDLNRIRWQQADFDQLGGRELYLALELRQQVFILEQRCLYADLDGVDFHCGHLLAWFGDSLAGYLRVIPPDVHASGCVAIGRVVVSPAARGAGMGRALMERGMSWCRQRYPGVPLVVSAQAHLQNFYESLGFAVTSDVYLEDGIPHVDMRNECAPEGGQS